MQNFGIFWNEIAHFYGPSNNTLRWTICKNYIQIGWKIKPLEFWKFALFGDHEK
jgi:hypothetical protein